MSGLERCPDLGGSTVQYLYGLIDDDLMTSLLHVTQSIDKGSLKLSVISCNRTVCFLVTFVIY